MDSFQPGSIVYHKASHKKLVVVEVNSNGNIHVQDDKGQDQTYPSQVLETEAVVEARQKAQAEKFLNDLNGGSDDDLGFGD